MSAQKTVYYADQWMCEIPGVAGDLTEVAKQLAEGVKCGSDDDVWSVEPQATPSRHEASAVTYFWVPCSRVDGEYIVPLNLPGEVHAVAYGNGSGWSPDMMVFDRSMAHVMLAENGTEDVEYLVCRGSDIRGELILTEGPECRFEARIGGGV